MAKIVQIYFDGEKKDCLVQTDDNGEVTCMARDGRFVKFPAPPKDADLDKYVDEMVERENADESNTVVPVFAEEAEAKKAELDAWLTELPDDHPRKADRETQTISASEVGSVEDVLGGKPK